MMTLNPYLVFNNDCEEAFNFYKAVFSGSELYLGRYKDVPEGARKFFPNAQTENIMHATLVVNKNMIIQGNDNPGLSGQPATTARDFYLLINADNTDDAIHIFNKLSAGGKVVMPIGQTFWAACYGVLTDKFGIHWKITTHG